MANAPLHTSDCPSVANASPPFPLSSQTVEIARRIAYYKDCRYLFTLLTLSILLQVLTIIIIHSSLTNYNVITDRKGLVAFPTLFL
jgi:hypothetical protein